MAPQHRRPYAHHADPSDARPLPLDDSDDDDDGGPPLDEQEQEELIASLSAQNASRDAQFRLALLALPALAALPLLAPLLPFLFPPPPSPPTAGTTTTAAAASASRLGAILGLTSLSCTAYLLYALPPSLTGIRALDAWVARSSSDAAAPTSGSGANLRRINAATASKATAPPPFWVSDRSPLQQHLPLLNGALAAVVLLTGVLTASSSRGGGGGGDLVASAAPTLPAVVYAVVLLAKTLMGGVDPERELAALRYEYKGA